MKSRFTALFAGNAITMTGWMPETYADGVEDFGALREKLYSDTGEINNTGELILAALDLADAGETEFYSTAEKMIRGHLLPGQVVDPEDWIEKLPGNRAQWESLKSFRGAFGFPAPYGPIPERVPYMVFGFHYDILVGAIDAIAEIVGRAHRTDGTKAFLNLLFSVESDALQVKDPYRNRNELYVKAKAGFTELNIRIPENAMFDLENESLAGKEPEIVGNYLRLKNIKPNDRINIPVRFDTVVLAETLNGQDLQTEWTGERVTRMSDFGAKLLYFAPLAPENN